MKMGRIIRCMLVGLFCACLLPVSAEEPCDHHYVKIEEPADCVNAGIVYYECTKCGHQYGHQNTPPLGHDFGEWTTEREPGCEQDGQRSRVCSRCDCRETEAIAALGHAYESRIVEPTCTKGGYTEHICSRCGDRYRTEEVPAAGHRYEEQTEPPTCTASGRVCRVCMVCGDREILETLPALGHEYDGGRVTREPTDTAMGRITYTCIRCGETRTETIPKRKNPFVDVKKRDYFYEPVLWAVEAGITSGTDETHFSPNRTCTRAQVVTFLWKAAGAPEPQAACGPFADVPAESYYSRAVLWAAEQGITAGVDETHFGPDRGCTRAQVVTFLYRAKGQPDYEAVDRFQDVQRGDYFFGPVCWAAQNGITAGADGGHFAPAQVCTRGQIVTFLYRDHCGG